MSKHDELPSKIDYETKYKALEQAVKDAISEIRDNSNMASSLMLSKSDKSYGYISEGMDDAISIIKRETGITA